MKKLAALILSLALCMGLTVPAMAASTETFSANGITVTVTNVIKKETKTVNLDDAGAEEIEVHILAEDAVISVDRSAYSEAEYSYQEVAAVAYHDGGDGVMFSWLGGHMLTGYYSEAAGGYTNLRVVFEGEAFPDSTLYLFEGLVAQLAPNDAYEKRVDMPTFYYMISGDTTSVDPEQPDTPTEPENPDTPTQPENPDEQPDTPTQPEQPDTPTQPENPDEQPDTPAEPEEPSEPEEPVEPEEPAEQERPSRPNRPPAKPSFVYKEPDPSAAPAQPAAPAAPAAPQFTDVAADSPYADAIDWAVGLGITNGTGNGTTFSPAQTCNVQQILTFLWRAHGSPEPSTVNPFSDNAEGPFYKAAVWAYEAGIISGDQLNGTADCTRAMTMEFLWKAAGKPGSAKTASFTDVAGDAAAISWAVEQGITLGTGDGSTFSPAQTCSRGQIVTFLYRFLVQ